MIIVHATIVSKPEGREALNPLVMECISETRKETGCISYELYASLEQENTAMFIETWESQAALDTHTPEKFSSASLFFTTSYFVSTGQRRK